MSSPVGRADIGCTQEWHTSLRGVRTRGEEMRGKWGRKNVGGECAYRRWSMGEVIVQTKIKFTHYLLHHINSSCTVKNFVTLVSKVCVLSWVLELWNESYQLIHTTYCIIQYIMGWCTSRVHVLSTFDFVFVLQKSNTQMIFGSYFNQSWTCTLCHQTSFPESWNHIHSPATL